MSIGSLAQHAGHIKRGLLRLLSVTERRHCYIRMGSANPYQGSKFVNTRK